MRSSNDNAKDYYYDYVYEWAYKDESALRSSERTPGATSIC
jgi:hypothetical protein